MGMEATCVSSSSLYISEQPERNGILRLALIPISYSGNTCCSRTWIGAAHAPFFPPVVSSVSSDEFSPVRLIMINRNI